MNPHSKIFSAFEKLGLEIANVMGRAPGVARVVRIGGPNRSTRNYTL
jgi:hypothetical protein